MFFELIAQAAVPVAKATAAAAKLTAQQQQQLQQQLQAQLAAQGLQYRLGSGQLHAEAILCRAQHAAHLTMAERDCGALCCARGCLGNDSVDHVPIHLAAGSEDEFADQC